MSDFDTLDIRYGIPGTGSARKRDSQIAGARPSLRLARHEADCENTCQENRSCTVG